MNVANQRLYCTRFTRSILDAVSQITTALPGEDISLATGHRLSRQRIVRQREFLDVHRPGFAAFTSNRPRSLHFQSHSESEQTGAPISSLANDIDQTEERSTEFRPLATASRVSLKACISGMDPELRGVRGTQGGPDPITSANSECGV